MRLSKFNEIIKYPVLRRKKACLAVKYNYQKLLQLVNEWSKKEYEK